MTRPTSANNTASIHELYWGSLKIKMSLTSVAFELASNNIVPFDSGGDRGHVPADFSGIGHAWPISGTRLLKTSGQACLYLRVILRKRKRET